MAARPTPTTRGSVSSEMFAQLMPDQWHGVGSFSFQSENAVAPSPSTADLRVRRARPSEERETTGWKKKRKMKKNRVTGI